MDNLDAAKETVKRAVGLHGKIAADVYPNGVVLKCNQCGRSERHATADAASYLARGWPKHCGQTMSSEPADG